MVLATDGGYKLSVMDDRDAAAGHGSIRALGRVGFIGAGRVAGALALAFARAGLDVRAVHSRGAASAQALAGLLRQRMGAAVAVAEDGSALLAQCDTVLITVNDDQIEPVASALPWRADQNAIHCSGATELTALSAASSAGAVVAGFHPLMTFGDPDVALASLPGCAVAVECADLPLRQALWDLALALGAQPMELPEGSRALYHASAHCAGALVATLVDQAVQHWARFGVSEARATAALLPLLRSTVESMASRGLAGGLAGVVARADVSTLARHLRALGQVGREEERLYAELTRRSIGLALRSGRISAQAAESMQDVLRQSLRPGP